MRSKNFFKVLLVLSFYGAWVWAQTDHKAHVHGESEWSLALDGSQGSLEIEIPSETVMGFEFEARKAKHVAQKNKAFDLLEKKIGEMVKISADYGCQWSKKKIEQQFEEGKKNHSEVVAEFSLSCAKDLAGARVELNLQKFFPKIKKARVQLLYGDIQKSLIVTRNGDFMEVK